MWKCIPDTHLYNNLGKMLDNRKVIQKVVPVPFPPHNNTSMGRRNHQVLSRIANLKKPSPGNGASPSKRQKTSAEATFTEKENLPVHYTTIEGKC